MGSTRPVVSYHYPPCPRQTLPVRWKLPGRGMRHRPPAPSHSPAGPPRSWAGRGRAAAVSRDLPASPIPSHPAPQPQHSAGSIPVFIQHKHQGRVSGSNSLQRVPRLRAHSTEDNANISGAEESSQHQRFGEGRVGIRPPAHVGSARGCNALPEQAGAWCRMRWLKGSCVQEL